MASQLFDAPDRLAVGATADASFRLPFDDGPHVGSLLPPSKSFYGPGAPPAGSGKVVQPQTYQFPGNVVKLDATNFDLEQEIRDELGVEER